MRTMNALLCSVLLFASSNAVAKCARSSKESAHAALDKLRADYLEGLFRAKPHLATFMGDHRFDDRLPDLSPASLKARAQQLDEQETRVQSWKQCEAKAASLDDNIDSDILQGGIQLEQLYLAEIKDWTRDPRLHDSFPYYDPREIVAGRLSDVIHGDYAPEPERRKAVLGQLKALPRFLDQMKAALNNPSPVFTRQAIDDNKGRIEFFETEVREFVGKDPEAEKARQAAVLALRDYQSFLEKDLLPRSKGDWRLGAAL